MNYRGAIPYPTSVFFRKLNQFIVGRVGSFDSVRLKSKGRRPRYNLADGFTMNHMVNYERYLIHCLRIHNKMKVGGPTTEVRMNVLAETYVEYKGKKPNR
jgi:hypothetical protein